MGRKEEQNVARMTWKVGQLAKRTGVSVRTLHYYEEIGLLSPTQRTDSGHRLYTPADVRRLHQIRSLRHIGFTLTEIHGCFARATFSPRQVIEVHMRQLDEQIDRLRTLHGHLGQLMLHIGQTGDMGIDAFLHTLEEMTMSEKTYYTAEQAAYLKARHRVLGDERIHQVLADYKSLRTQFRMAREQGLDPTDARVQALIADWRSLREEYSGGVASILQALDAQWEDNVKNDPEERRLRAFIMAAQGVVPLAP